jgi:hypothetical protein
MDVMAERLGERRRAAADAHRDGPELAMFVAEATAAGLAASRWIDAGGHSAGGSRWRGVLDGDPVRIVRPRANANGYHRVNIVFPGAAYLIACASGQRVVIPPQRGARTSAYVRVDGQAKKQGSKVNPVLTYQGPVA